MRQLSQRTLSRFLCLGAPAFTLAACSGELDGEGFGESQAALTVTTSFQQGVAAYTGSTDATLRQAAAGTNYGAATTCEADGDDGSGVDKSCVLRWALTGLPADAVITSASITLQVTNTSPNTYDVYALTRSWDEGQVTWNNAATGSPWGTPGALSSSERGPLVGSISATATGLKTITLNAAGIALVQAWADGSANHGVIIASSSNTDGIDIASSEASSSTQRPKLSLTYTTNSGSGGAGGSAGSSAGGAAGSSAGGSAGSAGSGSVPGGTPQSNVLIAFIGDQGNGSSADAVLNLIRNEGAHATVHNGDFDYANNPAAFENRVNAILGSSYPYYAVIGNHDAAAWGGTNGYGAKIAARVARVPSMNCTGEMGVKANCNFRGVHLIQSCVGVSELRSTCNANAADQVNFLQASLAASAAPFKICSWHKNQNDMQTGSKGNEVGWQAYQRCIAAGAIVSTGHEHAYSRTGILTDIGNATNHGVIASGWATPEVYPNHSFVFVSGLGGVDIRDFEASGHSDDTWWATTYASNRWYKNGALQPATTATYGALFVNFHDGGNLKRATAYFKDLNGRLIDQFTITLP